MTTDQTIAGLSFEEARDRLAEIVEKLQDESIGLEESLALWEQGRKLYAHCTECLEKVTKKISEIEETSEKAEA